MSSSLNGWKRSGYCADYGKEHAGQQVTLMGWVQRTRRMGSIIFVWLRDRTGLIQVNFEENACPAEVFAIGESLRSEYVLAVKGEVTLRDAATVNAKLKTGEIEVQVQDVVLINRAQTPPIYIDDDHPDESEAVRLKYRYLDLRRPSVQRNLQIRSKLTKATHDYFDSMGFSDIETPMLCISTPEGARDYLVPSRVHQGSFYALPQSPQIYKQLLMLSGFDRYYQIVRCFRDEDLRADRQPEFTQIDVEMSFADEEDILAVGEGYIHHIFKEVLDIDIPLPLPRLTWREAMDRYGSDKPDVRFGLELINISEQVKDCGFKVFDGALEMGGSVRALCLEGGASLTRKEIDALTETCKTYKAKGMAWAVVNEDGSLRSSFAKFLSEETMNAILEKVEAKPGDAIFIVADKNTVVWAALGALRKELGAKFHLYDPKAFAPLWITEFPMYEYSEEEERFVAQHHPFTAPMEEDIDKMKTDPGAVRARAYDAVMNGYELGSGSIRIHQADLQQKVFESLGFTPEQAWERFGFLLGAFQYGAPPHCGFAMGIDRLTMLLCGTDAIRDVIAFPKVQNASCLMTSAPTPVDDKQLEVLGITVNLPEKTEKE